MIDENLARLRARRNNVHRYRRLLATQLTGLERAYIERRLARVPSPRRQDAGPKLFGIFLNFPKYFKPFGIGDKHSIPTDK
jgi:hypothetical protein